MPYRGCLLLGSHTNRTGFIADLACNIIVGSYDLLTCLTRPSERPGHATATVVIRSKPIAPGGLIVQRAFLPRPYSIVGSVLGQLYRIAKG
jgi:hypothetical protein